MLIAVAILRKNGPDTNRLKVKRATSTVDEQAVHEKTKNSDVKTMAFFCKNVL